LDDQPTEVTIAQSLSDENRRILANSDHTRFCFPTYLITSPPATYQPSRNHYGLFESVSDPMEDDHSTDRTPTGLTGNLSAVQFILTPVNQPHVETLNETLNNSNTANLLTHPAPLCRFQLLSIMKRK
jgi:hypothetical protein